MVSRETLSCSRPLTLAVLCWCPLARDTHTFAAKKTETKLDCSRHLTHCVYTGTCVCEGSLFQLGRKSAQKRQRKLLATFSSTLGAGRPLIYLTETSEVCLLRVCLLIGSENCLAFGRLIQCVCVCECVNVLEWWPRTASVCSARKNLHIC